METSSLNLDSTPAGTSEGPSTSQRNGAFPERFTIYRHAKLSRTYILGDGPDSPIYALSYQGSDTSGQPQIILHSGPQSDTTPLATVSYKDLQSPMVATISGRDSKSGREEALSPRMSFPYLAYTFAIETATGERESFEWRHSSGAAIASLGVEKSGWKLVRLGAGGKGTSKTDASVVESGGDAVVAAWAKGKGKEEARFAFFGGGLAGSLGRSWEVMAVVTSLAIFQRDRSNIRGRR